MLMMEIELTPAAWSAAAELAKMTPPMFKFGVAKICLPRDRNFRKSLRKNCGTEKKKISLRVAMARV